MKTTTNLMRAVVEELGTKLGHDLVSATETKPGQGNYLGLSKEGTGPVLYLSISDDPQPVLLLALYPNLKEAYYKTGLVREMRFWTGGRLGWTPLFYTAPHELETLIEWAKATEPGAPTANLEGSREVQKRREEYFGGPQALQEWLKVTVRDMVAPGAVRADEWAREIIRAGWLEHPVELDLTPVREADELARQRARADTFPTTTIPTVVEIPTSTTVTVAAPPVEVETKLEASKEPGAPEPEPTSRPAVLQTPGVIVDPSPASPTGLTGVKSEGAGSRSDGNRDANLPHDDATAQSGSPDQPRPVPVYNRISLGGMVADLEGFALRPLGASGTGQLWYLSMVGDRQAVESIWAGLVNSPPKWVNLYYEASLDPVYVDLSPTERYAYRQAIPSSLRVQLAPRQTSEGWVTSKAHLDRASAQQIALLPVAAFDELPAGLRHKSQPLVPGQEAKLKTFEILLRTEARPGAPVERKALREQAQRLYWRRLSVLSKLPLHPTWADWLWRTAMANGEIEPLDALGVSAWLCQQPDDEKLKGTLGEAIRTGEIDLL